MNNIAYDQFVGYAVQGLCTGIGTALALFIFEKYLKPTLEKNHERLAQIPIPVPKQSTDKGFIATRTVDFHDITEPPKMPKW